MTTSTPAATGPGLRERKKQRTRQTIFDAAFRLFAERGYDNVTMTEIAREADVAPATVFTHYSSKGDLFYGLRHEMNAALVASMSERAAEGVRAGGPGDADKSRGDSSGETVLAVVAGWLRRTLADFCAPHDIDRSRTFARVLLGTPSLQGDAAGVNTERRELLATLLAERCPDADPFDVDVAAALIGAAVTSAFTYFHRDLAAGLDPQEITARNDARIDRAFEVVAGGLQNLL